jgi:hypothetical protein
MEYESRKHWLPTQASILSISIFAVLFVALFIGSCNTTPNKDAVKYAKLIDSITSDLNIYYVDLQAIDDDKIYHLQSEITKYKSETEFVENENIQSSLETADRFLSTFSHEKTLCLQDIKLNMKQLQETKNDASAMTVAVEGNQLQLQNMKQFDDAKFKAEYLINRYHAQELLIETLTIAKNKKVE